LNDVDPQPASPDDVPNRAIPANALPADTPAGAEPPAVAGGGPTDAGQGNEPAFLPKPPKRRSGTRTAIEWIILIVAAVGIALLIKTFLFQAFYIPSGSMLPTLEQNDRVLVNKLSYKLHPVHRGDIVVFTAPKGPDGQPIDPTVKDLVKRVIGLPGESVSEEGGKVYINGQPLKESYLPTGTVTDCSSFNNPRCFEKAQPVPPNEYWVMGDNRSYSKDSRYFGPIEKKTIVGRVFIRIWPLNRIDLL
jgi:signal peptidase I